MANVTKKIEERSKYILELNEAEAKTLKVLCANVCGSFNNSPRVYVERIYWALKTAVKIRPGGYKIFYNPIEIKPNTTHFIED